LTLRGAGWSIQPASRIRGGGKIWQLARIG